MKVTVEEIVEALRDFAVMPHNRINDLANRIEAYGIEGMYKLDAEQWDAFQDSLKARGEPVGVVVQVTNAGGTYVTTVYDGKVLSAIQPETIKTEDLLSKQLDAGTKLYTAPPSIDALIAEIDELCFDEWSGGYFWPEPIQPSVLKEITDKYRGQKK